MFNLNDHLMENGELETYAFPGGYPIFYMAADNGVICPKCCNDNFERLRDKDDKQWYIVDTDVNYEDENLTCDHSQAH